MSYSSAEAKDGMVWEFHQLFQSPLARCKKMGKGEDEELTNTERLRKENMKVIELSLMLSVKLENQRSRLCLVLEK